MKRTVEYRVAEGSTAYQLQGAVDVLLDQGYEPLGGVVVTALPEQRLDEMLISYALYSQSMVKCVE